MRWWILLLVTTGLALAITSTEAVNGSVLKKTFYADGSKEFTIVKNIKKNQCTCSCTCIPESVINERNKDRVVDATAEPPSRVKVNKQQSTDSDISTTTVPQPTKATSEDLLESTEAINNPGMQRTTMAVKAIKELQLKTADKPPKIVYGPKESLRMNSTNAVTITDGNNNGYGENILEVEEGSGNDEIILKTDQEGIRKVEHEKGWSDKENPGTVNWNDNDKDDDMNQTSNMEQTTTVQSNALKIKTDKTVPINNIVARFKTNDIITKLNTLATAPTPIESATISTVSSVAALLLNETTQDSLINLNEVNKTVEYSEISATPEASSTEFLVNAENYTENDNEAELSQTLPTIQNFPTDDKTVTSNKSKPTTALNSGSTKKALSSELTTKDNREKYENIETSTTPQHLSTTTTSHETSGVVQELISTMNSEMFENLQATEPATITVRKEAVIESTTVTAIKQTVTSSTTAKTSEAIKQQPSTSNDASLKKKQYSVAEKAKAFISQSIASKDTDPHQNKTIEHNDNLTMPIMPNGSENKSTNENEANEIIKADTLATTNKHFTNDLHQSQNGDVLNVTKLMATAQPQVSAVKIIKGSKKANNVSTVNANIIEHTSTNNKTAETEKSNIPMNAESSTTSLDVTLLSTVKNKIDENPLPTHNAPTSEHTLSVSSVRTPPSTRSNAEAITANEISKTTVSKQNKVVVQSKLERHEKIKQETPKTSKNTDNLGNEEPVADDKISAPDGSTKNSNHTKLTDSKSIKKIKLSQETRSSPNLIEEGPNDNVTATLLTKSEAKNSRRIIEKPLRSETFLKLRNEISNNTLSGENANKATATNNTLISEDHFKAQLEKNEAVTTTEPSSLQINGSDSSAQEHHSQEKQSLNVQFTSTPKQNTSPESRQHEIGNIEPTEQPAFVQVLETEKNVEKTPEVSDTTVSDPHNERTIIATTASTTVVSSTTHQTRTSHTIFVENGIDSHEVRTTTEEPAFIQIINASTTLHETLEEENLTVTDVTNTYKEVHEVEAPETAPFGDTTNEKASLGDEWNTKTTVQEFPAQKNTTNSTTKASILENATKQMEQETHTKFANEKTIQNITNVEGEYMAENLTTISRVVDDGKTEAKPTLTVANTNEASVKVTFPSKGDKKLVRQKTKSPEKDTSGASARRTVIEGVSKLIDPKNKVHLQQHQFSVNDSKILEEESHSAKKVTSTNNLLLHGSEAKITVQEIIPDERTETKITFEEIPSRNNSSTITVQEVVPSKELQTQITVQEVSNQKNMTKITVKELIAAEKSEYRITGKKLSGEHVESNKTTRNQSYEGGETKITVEGIVNNENELAKNMQKSEVTKKGEEKIVIEKVVPNKAGDEIIIQQSVENTTGKTEKNFSPVIKTAIQEIASNNANGDETTASRPSASGKRKILVTIEELTSAGDVTLKKSFPKTVTVNNDTANEIIMVKHESPVEIRNVSDYNKILQSNGSVAALPDVNNTTEKKSMKLQETAAVKQEFDDIIATNITDNAFGGKTQVVNSTGEFAQIKFISAGNVSVIPADEFSVTVVNATDDATATIKQQTLTTLNGTEPSYLTNNVTYVSETIRKTAPLNESANTSDTTFIEQMPAAVNASDGAIILNKTTTSDSTSDEHLMLKSILLNESNGTAKNTTSAPRLTIESISELVNITEKPSITMKETELKRKSTSELSKSLAGKVEMALAKQKQKLENETADDPYAFVTDSPEREEIIGIFSTSKHNDGIKTTIGRIDIAEIKTDSGGEGSNIIDLISNASDETERNSSSPKHKIAIAEIRNSQLLEKISEATLRKKLRAMLLQDNSVENSNETVTASSLAEPLLVKILTKASKVVKVNDAETNKDSKNSADSSIKKLQMNSKESNSDGSDEKKTDSEENESAEIVGEFDPKDSADNIRQGWRRALEELRRRLRTHLEKQKYTALHKKQPNSPPEVGVLTEESHDAENADDQRQSGSAGHRYVIQVVRNSKDKAANSAVVAQAANAVNSSSGAASNGNGYDNYVPQKTVSTTTLNRSNPSITVEGHIVTNNGYKSGTYNNSGKGEMKAVDNGGEKPNMELMVDDNYQTKTGPETDSFTMASNFRSELNGRQNSNSGTVKSTGFTQRSMNANNGDQPKNGCGFVEEKIAAEKDRLKAARLLREEQERLERLHDLQRGVELKAELERQEQIKRQLEELAKAERYQREMLERQKVLLKERQRHELIKQLNAQLPQHSTPNESSSGTSGNSGEDAEKIPHNFRSSKANLIKVQLSEQAKIHQSQCDAIRTFARIYEMHNPGEWVERNCAFARQYFRKATCAQLRQLFDSCF